MKTLPVLAAFSHAFRSTTHNLGFAFQVSWPWMLALLPINIAGNLYFLANSFGNSEEMNPKVFAAVLIMGICGMIAFASIAVNWHRYILLDEVPHGMERLRLDATVWRYVGNILLIGLILVVGAGGIGIVLVILAVLLGTVGQFVAVIGAVALTLFSIVASYRLSIKLPAIALGRQDYGLLHAWTATARNSWRFLGLLLILFIVSGLAALAGGLVGFGLGTIGGNVGVSISVAVQLAVNWVLAILGVTMLTSLYGYFVEGREF